MPPKDFKEQTLYFQDDDGNFSIIGHIGERLHFCEGKEGGLAIFTDEQLSFEVNMQPSSVKYALVEMGAKRCVPNNWLKMHGIPMNRRR